MLQSARKVRAMSGLGASCSRSSSFASTRSLSSSSSFEHVKDEDFREKNVWNVPPLIRGNCADCYDDEKRKKSDHRRNLRRTMTTKIATRGFASSYSSKSYSKDDETSERPAAEAVVLPPRVLSLLLLLLNTLKTRTFGRRMFGMFLLLLGEIARTVTTTRRGRRAIIVEI